eukprot:m.228020 g.228020  ORF g.228020 m.228020 type:complete len:252 (+) comp33534_c0_seq2:607-1362(+)
MWLVESLALPSRSPIQYYGKWPFARFLGVQEPASVVFSAANLLVHLTMSQRYKAMHTNIEFALCGRLWLAWGCLCTVTWACAVVFHVRDVSLTEKMDYFSATAGIMSMMYCSLFRVFRLHERPIAMWMVALGFVASYANHLRYLLSGASFDYGYNTVFNASFIVLNIFLWVPWWRLNQTSLPHAWKAALFTVVVPVFASTELLDFSPVLNVLDAHATWHALTVPAAILWWSFLLDDAKYMSETTLAATKHV